MASVKTVRLRNAATGVVVETNELAAGRLSGFDTVDKPVRKAAVEVTAAKKPSVRKRSPKKTTVAKAAK